jgi:hypothetical protein
VKTDHKTTTKCPSFCQKFFPYFLQNKAETQEIQELNLQKSGFMLFTESVCFHILHRMCFSIFFKQSVFPYCSQNMSVSIFKSQNLTVSIFKSQNLSVFYILHSKNLSIFIFFTKSGCFHILQRIYLFSKPSENLSIYLSSCFHILRRICFLAGSL